MLLPRLNSPFFSPHGEKRLKLELLHICLVRRSFPATACLTYLQWFFFSKKGRCENVIRIKWSITCVTLKRIHLVSSQLAVKLAVHTAHTSHSLHFQQSRNCWKLLPSCRVLTFEIQCHIVFLKAGPSVSACQSHCLCVALHYCPDSLFYRIFRYIS